MRPLELKDAELMTVAVKQEIDRSEEARYDHRLHGLLLVAHGLTCQETGELLGQDPVTIQRWVHHFNEHGFAGLQEGERSGRPTRLQRDDLSGLESDLRRSPHDFGYGQNLWDGKLLAHHVTARYHVVLGVRQCQRLFNQFGFRRRKPRPVIAKGDPVAQATYKKTTPSGQRRGS